ncbi:MAG: hypothetical protein R3C14_22085 [Caldilineaceae bacterium]
MRVLLLLLLACALASLLVFGIVNSAKVQAQNNLPTLTIATDIQASAGSTVTVPIDFRNNGRAIASIAFAIEVNPTCLYFDPIDQNGDYQYDAVTFLLPAQLRGSTKADPASGRLEIVIADYAPPLATLPDTDGMVQLTFMANCAPEAGENVTTAINFSTEPAASFSDPQGKTVAGVVVNGTVVINSALAPSPTPTLIPTVAPTPALPPDVSLAVSAWAAPSVAQAGDKILYTYQVTNTGEVSITIAGVSDQLGAVLLTRLVGSTENTPVTLLPPGEVVFGVSRYTVQPCPEVGPLVNTISVTGKTPNDILFTIQSSASVMLTPAPVLAPLTAAANTIYTGCAIQLSIAPTATRDEQTYDMVVIAGAPPAELVLTGVQEIYPDSGLPAMVEQTNGLIVAGCVNALPCNTVRRILFGYGAGYQIQIIQFLERVTDYFLPIVHGECLIDIYGC